MKDLLIPKYKLLFVIILTILLLIPFLTKAFHIDDTIVIYSAREMQKIPFHLSGSTVNWQGRPQTLRSLSDSPLISYYTAFLIKIKGESELWLHIFFLVFPIMTIISMYFLSKRFTLHPLISTLLLVSTPAFLVSSTNIMQDAALLSFYLAAVSTFIYAIDRESKLLLSISGFTAGLAALTKYTGFSLIPLFFFYAILKRKLSRGLLAIFVSFIIPAIWCLGDFIFFKRIQIIEVLQEFYKPSLFVFISNLFGSLTYIGSVTVFSLLFLFLIEKKRDLFSLMVWMAAILFVERLLKFKYTLPQSLLSAFFMSISIFFCQKFIGFLRRKDIPNYVDTIFLLIWFGIIFGVNVFVLAWYTAPKYTLILITALILLLMKKYEVSLFKRMGKSFYNFIYIGIALNFLFSLLINFADYSFANAHRNFTKTYAKYLKEKNTKVWFRGHWGFQYYMEKEGFTYLGIDDIPKKDDIIIMATHCDYEAFSLPLKERLKFIGSIKYETSYFLRTISPADKINFYSYTIYGIGSFPYGISWEPLEVFLVWQVE